MGRSRTKRNVKLNHNISIAGRDTKLTLEKSHPVGHLITGGKRSLHTMCESTFPLVEIFEPRPAIFTLEYFRVR